MLQACQIYEENSYHACKVYQCVSLVTYLQGIFVLQKDEISNEFSAWGERTHKYSIPSTELILLALCTRANTVQYAITGTYHRQVWDPIRYHAKITAVWSQESCISPTLPQDFSSHWHLTTPITFEIIAFHKTPNSNSILRMYLYEIQYLEN